MASDLDVLQRRYRQEKFRAERASVPELRKCHETAAEHFKKCILELNGDPSLEDTKLG